MMTPGKEKWGGNFFSEPPVKVRKVTKFQHI